MEALQHTLWLAGQTSAVLFLTWHLTLPLAVAFAVGLGWLLKHRPLTVGAKAALAALVLCPVSVLLLGGAFPPDQATGFVVPEQFLAALLILIAVALMAFVAFAPRQRTATLALACFNLWLSFCAATVAGMSIRGDWI